MSPCSPLVVYIICLVLASEAALRHVHIINRHGERVPTSYLIFPTEDPSLLDGLDLYLGEMTQRGVDQTVQLGQNLRERYGDLIAARYVPTALDVLAGADNRTIETANGLLAGFFSSNSSSVFGRRYAAVHTDFLVDAVSSGIFDVCPEISRSKRWNPEFLALIDKYQDVVDELEPLTGINITDVVILNRVVDVIKTRSAIPETLPLPKWAHSWIQPVRELNSKLHSEIVDYLGPSPGAWLYDRIIGKFDDALQNQTKNKFSVVSSHDTNIMSLARYLNFSSPIRNQLLGYASYLAVELHDGDDSKHDNASESVVKVFLHPTLNGTAQEVAIPECPSPCRFSTFRRLRRRVSTLQFLVECQGGELLAAGDLCTFYASSAAVLLLITVILVGVLISVIWSCLQYRSKYRKLSEDDETTPLVGRHH